ncbi:STAS domain-containing protein [Kitasatospora sp. NPDC054939]
MPADPSADTPLVDTEASADPPARTRMRLADTLVLDMTTGPDRTRAALHGEVFLDNATALHDALDKALHTSGTGLDLDLAPLTFCDSTGLNTLLRLRLAALAEGRTLTVVAASRQVRRLFELTETTDLFTPPVRGSRNP